MFVRESCWLNWLRHVLICRAFINVVNVAAHATIYLIIYLFIKVNRYTKLTYSKLHGWGCCTLLQEKFDTIVETCAGRVRAASEMLGV